MKLSKEEQKLNWYAVLESGSMTAVHNLREYIKSLEEENAELKKQLEVTNKENERIRRTMLTYSECITEHQNTIKRKDEENEQLKKQWHDCFLSCSSPYCAGHFPAVKMEGELGNMSKHEKK